VPGVAGEGGIDAARVRGDWFADEGDRADHPGDLVWSCIGDSMPQSSDEVAPVTCPTSDTSLLSLADSQRQIRDEALEWYASEHKS
jgi:hypothetical protein